MHGQAWHCRLHDTSGDTQEHVSTRPLDPKRPDIPANSMRLCTDETDGLESCLGMLSIHIHMRGDGNGSGSLISHTEEPQKLGNTINMSSTRTHAKSIRIDKITD